MTLSQSVVPKGFVPLKLKAAGYINSIGPLFGTIRDGHFVLGLRVEERHCNAIGICHGGMLASLCDTLLVIGLNIEGDISEFLLTVNLTTDFLSSAPLGSWLEGRVELVHKSNHLVFGQGSIALEDGTKILRTNGLMRIRGVRSQEFSPTSYF